MPTRTASNIQDRTRNENRLRSRIGLGIVGIIVAAVFGSLFVVLFGGVAGTEFSPDRFASRDYWFYRLPPFELQITPIYRSPATPPLAQYLKNTNLVPINQSSQPQWHQVSQTSIRGQIQGDAAILLRYLDAGQSVNHSSPWEAWTRKKTELAQVLWPHIATLAKDKKYIFIPEVMEIANFAKDPDQLEIEVAAKLSEKYGLAGEAAMQQEQFSDAVQLFTTAIQYQASLDSRWLRRRAEAHRILGNNESSEADQRTADEIDHDQP